MSKRKWQKRGTVHIIVDVESDGRPPGERSMVCFGAVVVDKAIGTKSELNFYGQVRPITDEYEAKALAISGFTREQHEKFDEPVNVMYDFKEWIEDVCDGHRPILWSDNNGYDAAFIDYYFLKFTDGNPFGYSSRRIGDLYCGFVNSLKANAIWKRKYRKTKHTHDPVDDARGNAEALATILEKMKERRNEQNS